MKVNSNEKGITLIVLVITMIILLILSTITIYTVWGEDGLVEQAQRTQNSVKDTLSEDSGNVNETMQEYENTMSQEPEFPEVPFEPGPTPDPGGGGASFTMSYGVIEIKWLEGDTYNVSDTPNAPKVRSISNGKMELVKYVEGGTTEQERWVPGTDYEYIAGTGTADNNQSRWANARVTIDGIDSYFVWIPRYAYRIVYFKDEASKNEYKNGTITEEEAIEQKKIVGYSDSRGIVTAEGKRVDSITSSSNTTHIMVSKDYFTPHPAFLDGTDNGFENGEWDDELEGLWIGKYETSRSDATSSSAGSGTILKVQPGVQSWRNQTIANLYNSALTYCRELESHMLKNSEWGAVTYLTESAYGRNGTEVTSNMNNDSITGGGIENEYVSNYNQSSTGNIYGTYDLAAGSYEYVAGYNKLKLSSQSTAIFNGNSDKYSTAYQGHSASSTFKYGDATLETKGWHKDYGGEFDGNQLYYIRSADYGDGEEATGIFYYIIGRWNA